MPIPVITSALIQAGIRLLSLIIDRAKEAHVQTKDAIFHIIELWARSLLDNPASLRTAFDSAQTEFANADWLQMLGLLLEYGKQKDVATFADNLWLAYFFRLGSAAEALWNQYPDLQRQVYIRGHRSLPHAWGEWVPPITGLMGHAEADLIARHPAFEKLLISADVFDLLEQEPEPEQEVITPPPRPETFFMPAMQVDAAATLSTYLAACAEQVGMIDPRGYVRDATVNIPLQNIYVPLRLVPLTAFNNPADYVRYQIADCQSKPETGCWLNTPVGGREIEAHDGIPEIDVLSKDRLILILGESGSGKTTLLYHIALEHVKALLEHQDSALTISTQANGNPRFTLAQPLPIYVDLADYVENLQPGESLPEFVTRTTASLARDDNVMALISTLLECGQCLLLLDGLDHVVNDEQRRMLGNSVSQAAEYWQADGNQVVVSSRPDEFTATPLQGYFTQYVIRPLGRRQISPFLMRWSLALTRLKNPMMSDDDALRQAESLTLTLSREITTNTMLGKLVNTPLMLRLLVGIYQPNMVFTPQRAAMIQVVSDSMIREWRLPQSETHNLLILEHEANHILGELAFWIHTLRPSGVVDEQELRQILSRGWSQIHPHSSEQQVGQAIEQFISHIRRYPGVLVEVSPRRYRFIHQVIQEYFAARYLVSSFRRAAMRIRAILHNPRWLEVIRLAVSFLALRSREDASDLINVAILTRDNRGDPTDLPASPFEETLQRDLFRAASLLIHGTEVTAEVSTYIADALMKLWLKGDRDDTGRFTLLFDKARRHLMALDGTAVSHNALRIACEHLSNRRDERTRAFAIDALSFWPSHFREAVEMLVSGDPEEETPTLVRRAMVGALGRTAPLTTDAYRALIAMLNDQDEWVSNRSRQVLAAAPPIPLETMNMWVDWLHGEPAARRVSLRTMRRMGSLPDAVISVLLHLLNNPDPDDPEILEMVLETFAGVTHLPDNALMAICRTAMSTSAELRCGAIQVLQRPTELPDEVVNYLIEWSYDPDAAIREASTRALGTCHNRSAEVYEALSERLNDQAAQVRSAAIEPLACQGQTSPRITHLLTHIAQDQDTGVRRALAQAFRHFPKPNEEIRRALQLLLSDSAPEVREATLDTIGKMEEPGEELIKLLISMIDVTNMELASKAVEALSALRDLPDIALLALVQQALPVHWEQHGSAIRECLKAHTPLNMEIVNQVMDLAVIQPVGTAYYNRAPTLRICALEVLGYVMDEAPDAVSILLGAVQQPEHIDVQLAALRGLGRARVIWPEVQETLLRLLEQGAFEVRAAAGIALGRLIGGLPDPPFSSEELEKLAESLETLVSEIRARASWESGAQLQDQLLFALNAVVARIQHQPPRLSNGRAERFPSAGD